MKNQCDVNYDPVKDADSYLVKITKDAPLDASKYVSIDDIFYTSSISFIVPAGFLGVPIWIKVTASNTAGKGPSSNPFGGRIIQ